MTLRVLHVVAGYPTPERPHNQSFIKAQIDSLVAAGVSCEVLCLRRRSIGKYLGGYFQVRYAVRRSSFDLLHSHYAYCATSCFCHGLPVVSSLLGSDLVGHADKEGRYSRRSRTAHRALARFVAGQSAACIVKSRQMRDDLGLDVHVIPNGVDIARFRPVSPEDRPALRASLGLRADCRYILFAGDPRRSVKRFPLAQAAAAVAAARVTFPLELIPLSGHDHDDVVRYMQACDLLLLTSTYEGSPNVVKEAMASGMAVVAVAVGDTRERLDGVSGCRVIEAADPEVIGMAIRDVLTSGEPLDGRRAVSGLRSEDVAARIIAIYENAVGIRKGDA